MLRNVYYFIKGNFVLGQVDIYGVQAKKILGSGGLIIGWKDNYSIIHTGLLEND